MALALLLLTLTIRAGIGDITVVEANVPDVEVDGRADVVRGPDSVMVTVLGHSVTVRIPGNQPLRARLETTIGDIRIERAAFVSGDVLRLRTFNGDVALGLSESPEHARILALSLGGTIQSQVPLARRTIAGPRFAEATFGRGDALVSIDVVQGDIRIAIGQ
jgi:hypothetical protein